MKEESQPTPFFKGVRHIGIAVKDTEAAVKLFSTLFEANRVETIVSQEHGLKLTFLTVAGANVELLEPVRDDVTVAKFLQTKGEGFHHIAFEVSDIEAVMANLRKAGIKLIDETPRRGAHGNLIAFLHPSSTHGMLIELSEPVKERPGGT